MSHLNFVTQLTNDQIAHFFKSFGFEFENINTSVFSDEKLAIELSNTNGSKMHYEVADDGIVDYNIDSKKIITNNDWKVYLRSIFGDAYITYLGYEDLPNKFIDKLTIDEVKKIFNFNSPIQIESIIEVQSLLSGTRRFKIIPLNAKGNSESEFILSPYMIYGFEHFSSKSPEGKFLKFMTKKFGKDYLDYYSKIEQRMIGIDIDTYIQTRNHRFKEVKAFMEKIISKNIS